MDFKDVPKGYRSQAVAAYAIQTNAIMTQALLQHYAAFLEKQFGIPAADTRREVGEIYHSNPEYKTEQQLAEMLITSIKDTEANL